MKNQLIQIIGPPKTGKTTCLIERAIELAEQYSIASDQICVIAANNQARQDLHARLKTGWPKQLLANPSDKAVHQTLPAVRSVNNFFLRTLRQLNPEGLSLKEGPALKMIDRTVLQVFVNQLIDQVVLPLAHSHRYAKTHPDFCRLIFKTFSAALAQGQVELKPDSPETGRSNLAWVAQLYQQLLELLAQSGYCSYWQITPKLLAVLTAIHQGNREQSSRFPALTTRVLLIDDAEVLSYQQHQVFAELYALLPVTLVFAGNAVLPPRPGSQACPEELASLDLYQNALKQKGATVETVSCRPDTSSAFAKQHQVYKALCEMNGISAPGTTAEPQTPSSETQTGNTSLQQDNFVYAINAASPEAEARQLALIAMNWVKTKQPNKQNPLAWERCAIFLPTARHRALLAKTLADFDIPAQWPDEVWENQYKPGLALAKPIFSVFAAWDTMGVFFEQATLALTIDWPFLKAWQIPDNDNAVEQKKADGPAADLNATLNTDLNFLEALESLDPDLGNACNQILADGNAIPLVTALKSFKALNTEQLKTLNTICHIYQIWTQNRCVSNLLEMLAENFHGIHAPGLSALKQWAIKYHSITADLLGEDLLSHLKHAPSKTRRTQLTLPLVVKQFEAIVTGIAGAGLEHLSKTTDHSDYSENAETAEITSNETPVRGIQVLPLAAAKQHNADLVFVPFMQGLPKAIYSDASLTGSLDDLLLTPVNAASTDTQRLPLGGSRLSKNNKPNNTSNTPLQEFTQTAPALFSARETLIVSTHRQADWVENAMKKSSTMQADALTASSTSSISIALSPLFQQLQQYCRQDDTAETLTSTDQFSPEASAFDGLDSLYASEHAPELENQSAETSETPWANLPKQPDILSVYGSNQNVALSAAAIKTLMTCPRQFYYRYVLKLPKSKNPDGFQVVVGQVVHRLLEVFNRNFKAANTPYTLQELQQVCNAYFNSRSDQAVFYACGFTIEDFEIISQWPELQSHMLQKTVEEAFLALGHSGYFERYGQLKTVLAEWPLKAIQHPQLPGCNWSGSIDACIQLPDGTWELIDYKTSTNAYSTGVATCEKEFNQILDNLPDLETNAGKMDGSVFEGTSDSEKQARLAFYQQFAGRLKKAYPRDYQILLYYWLLQQDPAFLEKEAGSLLRLNAVGLQFVRPDKPGKTGQAALRLTCQAAAIEAQAESLLTDLNTRILGLIRAFVHFLPTPDAQHIDDNQNCQYCNYTAVCDASKTAIF
ncbi:MAG: PD-(D/E)XK nuclease family protein [Cyanobacteria bacterium P01_H01_bin.74]